MNLTFRQLITFREVIRTGSVSEAARNLGRTQPSVSSVIAGLEDELDFKLFERRSGKLVAKPEAQFVLEEAEGILARLERTKSSLKNVRDKKVGEIRIACYPAASSYYMPQLLGEFLQDKPGVKASLMMRTSKAIEDMIASQQFDIGLLERPEPRGSFEQQDFKVDCVIALPYDDPLAELPSIEPSQIGSAPLAMLFDDHMISQTTRNWFDQFGLSPNRRFELQTFLPGLTLVESGLCYMICDGITARSYQSSRGKTSKIKFLQLDQPFSTEISIAWPKHNVMSNITALLVEKIVASLRSSQQVFDSPLK